MSRILKTPQHEAIRHFLIEKREKADLRQIDVAKRLKRPQSYVSSVETGQKIVSLVELLEWSQAIGFDPKEAIRRLQRIG